MFFIKINSKNFHLVKSLDEKLMIALDFETIFSNIAYVFSTFGKSNIFSILDCLKKY